MRKSWRTWGIRHALDRWPCYRGTGARVTRIAANWSEVRVTIPLSPRTRNYVGAVFGGSVFGGTVPLFMLMLIHRLGNGYIVWDKAAAIRFSRPGTKRLYADFTINDEELENIRALAAAQPFYTLELIDASGEVCAIVERTVYIKV